MKTTDNQSASMVYCSSESPSPPFISSFSSSSYSSCSSNHQLAFSSFTGGQQTELSTMPSCSSAIQLYASLWGRLYSPSASTTPEWSKPHMLSFEKPPSNSPRSSSPASAGSGNFGARHEVLPGSGIAFTAGPILADSELVYDPNYIPAGGDNFSVSTDTANPAHSDVHTVSCPLTWTYADVYPHLAYIPTPEEMLADKDAWQEKLPKGSREFLAHLRCTWQEFQSLPTFRADLTAASLLHSLMALPIAGQVVWNSGDAVSSKGMPTSSASVCTSAIGQAGQHESAKRTLTPSAADSLAHWLVDGPSIQLPPPPPHPSPPYSPSLLASPVWLPPSSALAPEPASNEFPSAASTACGQLNWPFGHHSNPALQTVLPRTNYVLQTADEDGFEAADYAEALSRFPASGLGTVWNRLTDGAYTLRSATAIRQQRDAGESELRMCLMALEKDITDQSISRTTVRRRSVDECTEDLPIRGPVSRRYRKARVYFQPQHTAILEAAYNKDNYLASKEREVLAKIVGVSEERIRTWFQNRRMREKRLFK